MDSLMWKNCHGEFRAYSTPLSISTSPPRQGWDLRNLETSPKIPAITSLQDHANHDRIMFALEYCP